MGRSLRTILNEANPNKVDTGLQQLPAGNALGLLSRSHRGTVAADTLPLPARMRAAVVLYCFAFSGGTTGQKLPVTGVPAAGQVAVDAKGNIVFAAADAVTGAEVVYAPMEGEVIEETAVVTADVLTLRSARRGLILLEAEALTGGSPGDKTVVVRGTAAPAAGEAALQDDATLVNFAAADAVTTARVLYVAQAGVGDQPGPIGATLDLEDKGY